MDEIRRRDTVCFLRELVAGPRIFGYAFFGFLTFVFAHPWSPFLLWQPYFFWMVFIGLNVWGAHRASLPKRFQSQRFHFLWSACQERHSRFKTALRQLSRKGVADLQELPRTIEAVSDELYRALRRADIVANEVVASEGWLVAQPRLGQPMSADPQAQELYRIADKNIAEYRVHYQGVMAGVQRTEAQAAVFTTTLDTLRMKMLSYRLVGRETESPTQEFLAALTEARMQLESIDKALEELDLTPFPRTISVVPDDVLISGDAPPHSVPTASPPTPESLDELSQRLKLVPPPIPEKEPAREQREIGGENQWH